MKEDPQIMPLAQYRTLGTSTGIETESELCISRSFVLNVYYLAGCYGNFSSKHSLDSFDVVCIRD